MPVRFQIIFLTILAVFICYIDRVNISIAIIPIAKELGWNYYMLPEIAARGSVLMLGIKGKNKDLSLEYQDLSIYEVYTKGNR